MTPRQLAVEQLLSHKLHGVPSQQGLVRPQSVETSAVSARAFKPDPSARQNADLTGTLSVASGALQVPNPMHAECDKRLSLANFLLMECL